MVMPAATMNDDGMKNSLAVSAVVHLVGLLLLYFGLPHLMPPLPDRHPPVSFQIVEIADLTNTRIKDEPKPEPQPEPPKPQETQAKPTPTPPAPPAPPEKPQPIAAEALKAAPVPKPKPVEPKTVNDDFTKLLKNLETKKQPAPKPVQTKADSKAPAETPTTQATSLSSRLTISEEDALRRQIESCWNPDAGARDAQNMIVDVVIDVNADRTVLNAEIIDKSRYASDGFFRAAADRALRAVLNPKCSPLELPAGKYDQWKRINFTFDPRDLL